MKYFLDTYAIIEIIKGNIKYKKYKDTDNITLTVNLAELCYEFIKRNDEKLIERFYGTREEFEKLSKK